MKQEKVLSVLKKSWTLDSSKKWTKDNPANGQCSVTALVLQDHFGGDILKTKVVDLWHFYNRIDNNIYDFTESQLSTKISYDNQLATREEALADTTIEEYEHLSNLFEKMWLSESAV